MRRISSSVGYKPEEYEKQKKKRARLRRLSSPSRNYRVTSIIATSTERKIDKPNAAN